MNYIKLDNAVMRKWKASKSQCVKLVKVFICYIILFNVDLLVE